MDELKDKVKEAIDRIRQGYEMTEGKLYLSFSGGKDSNTVAELIKMANLETTIPFLCIDTKVEYDAVYDFIRNYDYPNMVFIEPFMEFDEIIEKYGIPAISKVRSEYLSTYDKNIDNPNLLEMARMKTLIGGEIVKNNQGTGKKSSYALAEKHFHFLHPDRVAEYKISNKCCSHMKLHSLYEYKLFNDPKGYFTGMRMAEGGARRTAVTNWYNKDKKGIYSLTPIFDWTDELQKQFLEYYNVKLPIVYTEYGLPRTGCIGCPFARNCVKELEAAKKFEPHKYDEMMRRFKLVYIDQGIKIEFDEEYMEEFYERDEINKIRRQEMLDKYDDIRIKPWKFWE